MSSAEALASFVVDHRGDTVFVGLWQVKGSHAGDSPDPYRPPSPPGPGSTVIDLLRMTALDEYCGRIVVAWGGGERAWVQYAHRRDKPIAELRRQAEEPAFPGFGRFACGLHEVDVLPVSWSEPLRSSRGVYLLIHRSSGAQYVGSATGTEGFLGRWLCYADGHGGNLAMKELGHGADDFDVRILETVGSGATIPDVHELESLWKEKLGCRAHGLNRN